jgi:hypothetical protein
VDWVLGILLFLHVGGAIVGFGPTYAFLILGPMTAASRPTATSRCAFRRLSRCV